MLQNAANHSKNVQDRCITSIRTLTHLFLAARCEVRIAEGHIFIRYGALEPKIPSFVPRITTKVA